MANIRTYEAAPFSLTESDKGGQAWSQAGRRLGPLYNEAAQFTREAGKLAADNKAQLWPFDILELYQKNAANQPGTGFKVQSGGKGSGSNDPISDFSFERFPDLAAANGQISAGAAALGQSLNDGGQAMSRRQPRDQQQAPAGAPAEDMVLEGGNLVTASASRKAFQQYQQQGAAAVDQWTNDAANTANYWQQYNGNPRTDTRFDPSPTDMESLPPPPAPSTGGWFSGIANAFSGGASVAGGDFSRGASGFASDFSSSTGGSAEPSTAGGF